MNVAPLLDWINERHAIYLRKQLLEGQPIPSWANPARMSGVKPGFTLDHLTDDPVLKQYRFCNVFRELDRVTIWVRENIRERYADHPNLWLLLAIARTINWPETLADLFAHDAMPTFDDWTPHLLTDRLQWRKDQGEKVYTGAYMIRAESDPKAEWFSWTKQRYIAEVVIGRLWETRDRWNHLLNGGDAPGDPVKLQEVWSYFQSKYFIGWGPFMAYEVVTDLRHTRYLNRAPDIYEWANAGPGALRGLNRLSGLDPKEPLTQARANDMMRDLMHVVNEQKGKHVPEFEMRDVEHSLCEVDKWLRVRNGEGKPRAGYVRGRGW